MNNLPILHKVSFSPVLNLVITIEIEKWLRLIVLMFARVADLHRDEMLFQLTTF